ncbi:hypothetical protein SH528x_001600 [Novipirellula sp. SH528]|uniref:hypothetical protein n=1 Tax=Novipirellula sp. SH528 TaxID=3454466 RepID=UPI003FA0E38D
MTSVTAFIPALWQMLWIEPLPVVNKPAPIDNVRLFKICFDHVHHRANVAAK